jgi:hypothetical protein
MEEERKVDGIAINYDKEDAEFSIIESSKKVCLNFLLKNHDMT